MAEAARRDLVNNNILNSLPVATAIASSSQILFLNKEALKFLGLTKGKADNRLLLSSILDKRSFVTFKKSYLAAQDSKKNIRVNLHVKSNGKTKVVDCYLNKSSFNGR